MKCCDITPGMLRHSVELQSQTNTPNGSGGFTKSWSTYATVRAGMKATSGWERSAADRLDAQTKNKLTIRYRADIKESDRVLFRGRAYNIRFIDNVEFRDRWMVIDLDGGVAT